MLVMGQMQIYKVGIIFLEMHVLFILIVDRELMEQVLYLEQSHKQMVMEDAELSSQLTQLMLEPQFQEDQQLGLLLFHLVIQDLPHFILFMQM